MSKKTDYSAVKQKLKEFLADFQVLDDQGRKEFRYASQITNIAHRLETFIVVFIICLFNKDIQIDLEDKFLRNSKIFFIESFSLYIHILSRS